MEPVLRGRELLEVEPYGDRPVRAGDVVLFRSRRNQLPVVHRVIQVAENGIRTRGDNNRFDDAERIVQGDILGHVVAAWRGQKRCVIHGGLAGRLFVTWRRLMRRGLRLGGRWLGPAYRAVARSGVCRHLLPERWKPRVVSLVLDGVPVRRLYCGSRMIGEYDSRTGKWRIRRPFLLFVDAAALPSS